jgi:hypothetical protein
MCLAFTPGIDYLYTAVYIYSYGGRMEQMLRVQNERDRRVLSWLRATFDDNAITAAAQGCAAR